MWDFILCDPGEGVKNFVANLVTKAYSAVKIKAIIFKAI